ncbi:hypothetical protein D8797_04895 [Streptococcus cristatus]|nr:hypothetical protein D8797_04895 [Streptococcus cristatus]
MALTDESIQELQVEVLNIIKKEKRGMSSRLMIAERNIN